MGAHAVLRYSAPLLVHDAKVELRFGIALFGCQSIPLHRFGVILGDTLSLVVHDAEIGLRARIALHGSQSKPPHCIAIVLGDPAALFVHDPEVGLRRCVTVFGKRLEQLEGGSEITALVGGDPGFLFVERGGRFDVFRLDGDTGILLIGTRRRWTILGWTAIGSCLSIGASPTFGWSVTTTLRLEVASLPSGCLDLNVSS